MVYLVERDTGGVCYSKIGTSARVGPQKTR